MLNIFNGSVLEDLSRKVKLFDRVRLRHSYKVCSPRVDETQKSFLNELKIE